MEYTIKEASQLLNLTPVTLRFYDKEGLLPNMRRLKSGYRIFSDEDISILKLVECLKKTGMSIKEIKEYIDLLEYGNESLERRYEMIKERKVACQKQLDEMNKTMDFINYKCDYYKKLIDEKNK